MVYHDGNYSKNDGHGGWNAKLDLQTVDGTQWESDSWARSNRQINTYRTISSHRRDVMVRQSFDTGSYNDLAFALSGVIFAMYSFKKGTRGFYPTPRTTLERATQLQSFNQRKARALKLGALALGPATLMFPSAMVLYWFSSTLAAITEGYLRGKLPQIRIVFIRARKSPEKSESGEEKEKPKRHVEEPCPPTMKDLINQRKKRMRK